MVQMGHHAWPSHGEKRVDRPQKPQVIPVTAPTLFAISSLAKSAAPSISCSHRRGCAATLRSRSLIEQIWSAVPRKADIDCARVHFAVGPRADSFLVPLRFTYETAATFVPITIAMLGYRPVAIASRRGLVPH